MNGAKGDERGEGKEEKSYVLKMRADRSGTVLSAVSNRAVAATSHPRPATGIGELVCVCRVHVHRGDRLRRVRCLEWYFSSTTPPSGAIAVASKSDESSRSAFLCPFVYPFVVKKSGIHRGEDRRIEPLPSVKSVRMPYF